MSFSRNCVVAAVLLLNAAVAAGNEGAVQSPATAQHPGAARQGGELGSYSSILQRGVFGDTSGPPPGSTPAAPSSSYRLVGTLESGGFAGAVLDDGTGVQTFYRIGQKLPDDSRITQVWRDRILVKRPDGSVYELFTSDDARSPGRPAVPGDAPAVSPPADGGAVHDAQAGRPRPQRRRSPRADD